MVVRPAGRLMDVRELQPVNAPKGPRLMVPAMEVHNSDTSRQRNRDERGASLERPHPHSLQAGRKRNRDDCRGLRAQQSAAAVRTAHCSHDTLEVPAAVAPPPSPPRPRHSRQRRGKCGSRSRRRRSERSGRGGKRHPSARPQARRGATSSAGGFDSVYYRFTPSRRQ
eukprot:1736-Prymnesium_polylepis.1